MFLVITSLFVKNFISCSFHYISHLWLFLTIATTCPQRDSKCIFLTIVISYLAMWIYFDQLWLYNSQFWLTVTFFCNFIYCNTFFVTVATIAHSVILFLTLSGNDQFYFLLWGGNRLTFIIHCVLLKPQHQSTSAAHYQRHWTSCDIRQPGQRTSIV